MYTKLQGRHSARIAACHEGVWTIIDSHCFNEWINLEDNYRKVLLLIQAWDNNWEETLKIDVLL